MPIRPFARHSIERSHSGTLFERLLALPSRQRGRRGSALRFLSRNGMRNGGQTLERREHGIGYDTLTVSRLRHFEPLQPTPRGISGLSAGQPSPNARALKPVGTDWTPFGSCQSQEAARSPTQGMSHFGQLPYAPGGLADRQKRPGFRRTAIANGASPESAPPTPCSVPFRCLRAG